MRCEVAERALSAAMDDAAEPIDDDVAAHAAACPRCREYSDRAWHLRRLTRFEVSPPVPDLVPEIMRLVHADGRRALAAPVGGPPGRGAGRRGAWRRAVGLAAAVGLVSGFVVTSGVRGPSTAPTPALAAEIPHRLVAAAVALRGYRATFDVTERNWAPAVPVRSFVATVAFRAPEDLRVAVRDTTPYPQGEWMPNDLSLVSDGRTWIARGPQPCPEGTAPSCPGRADIARVVVRRIPFDGQSRLPTDVIVPMTVLAAQDRVDLIGPGTVGWRPAVGVRLAEHDAEPLWAFLQFLGSWRPFNPQDRVEVWLDARTWFPLKYEVFPAAGDARRLWARQLGLPTEPPDRAVFTAVARSFSAKVPPRPAFSVAAPGSGTVPVDEGFVEGPAPDVPTPVWTDGLTPVRTGAIEGAAGGRERIVAYARGLAWLTVEEVASWSQARPFGVGAFAEHVRLSIGPVAYEPASDAEPRRVAIHTDGAEYLLSTNLPRSTLLRIASSMPVEPREQPASWRVHRSADGTVTDGLDPGTALAAANFGALAPAWLPPGYLAAGAQAFSAPGVSGITVVYRRPAAELDGVGLALYQASGEILPPPTDDDQFQVRLRGTIARWSPHEHRLEWVEAGAYRSLTGPAFDLASLILVADSMRPEGPR